MITDEQVQLFMSIFRGRKDIFAKRWEKYEKSGYSPAYKFDWNDFLAFKAKGGKFSHFSNKKSLLLTATVIKSHLYGNQTIGVYPLLQDNTSYLIAADFDGENWQKESRAFINICKNNEIPTYLERSRSGKESHAWIFFQDKYPAYKSRKIILELIRKALSLSEFDKEVSFDRLFPSQDYHAEQGFGNLIVLPFQGISLKQENTAFLNPDTYEVFQNQWDFLKSIEKISLEKLNSLYQKFAEDGSTQPILESSGILQIKIQGQLKLRKDQLSPKLVQFLREKLNFFNTDYIVQKKIGLSTYKIDKYFKLVEETGDSILVPRGFLSELVSFCQEHEIAHVVLDERQKQPNIEFNSKIILRDYQKQALDDIRNSENGVIVAPSGSGKTIIGLELIAHKSQPALILVHRKQLLDQWVERIQSFLGIPKTHIGKLSGICKKTGKQITVAMIQSLTRSENLKELTNMFGTIIVDECHHIPAKTFRNLVSRFNAYYIYGLTATPQRKYNDEQLIFYYLGNIVVTIDQQQKASNAFPENLLDVKIRETNLAVPFDYKTDEFEVISKILIYDTARNGLICEDILCEAKGGRKILVLTERKEHVEILHLYLKNHAEIITLTGDDSLSKRKLKIAQIEAGNFQILIATGQLFGEGVDFSTINCLFLVYPFSFEGKPIQYIGRIQRARTHQILYDYRDKNTTFFERMFKKRLKHYKKLSSFS